MKMARWLVIVVVVLIGSVLTFVIIRKGSRAQSATGPLRTLAEAQATAYESADQIRSGIQIQQLADSLRRLDSERGGPVAADEDWVQLLLDRGYTEAWVFVSPAAEDSGVISYFYVPDDYTDGSSGALLLYEAPGLHPDGGLWIVRRDGRRVYWTAGADELMSELRSSEGRDWRPHESPRGAP